MCPSQCLHNDGPASAAEGEEAILLEWTVHLMRRDPGRAAVVYAATAAAFALGMALFGSLLFGIVGALLILSSTAEFLLPIRHTLTARRARVAYGLARLELPWADVRRVLRGPEGLRLSPLPHPSRLDAFRGVGLRFAADGSPGDRTDVERVLADRLPEPVAAQMRAEPAEGRADD